MWERIAKFFSDFMKAKGISLITSYILKALGIAGGFLSWVVAQVVKIGWKKAEKEIKSGARLADKDKSNEALREEYQNKIKEGASEEELIRLEETILNNGRSRKR